MKLPASFPSGLRAALRLLRDEVRIYQCHRKGTKKTSKYIAETNLKLTLVAAPILSPTGLI